MLTSNVRVLYAVDNETEAKNLTEAENLKQFKKRMLQKL